jgi:hypothetical protein
VRKQITARLVAASFCAVCVLAVAAESRADTHLLVITGVSGGEEHAKQFHDWATKLLDAARDRGGVADENIVYLAERTDLDPARIRGRSTKEVVETTLAALARRVKPNDDVFVVLIGHGSFDGKQGAFNLPGPDPTVADWAKLLARFGAQRVAFVNTSSSSGAFLALAGPGRAVVTATKTGGERNETRFPRYFVEAFSDESADRDRNGRVSVIEAFDYAKGRVVKSYEQEGNLLTEHATLDDGTGGKLATTLYLGAHAGVSTLKVDTTDPEMRRLVAERDALDKRITDLKLAKEGMEPARYEQELEKLLTELALKTKAIRDLQAKKDGKS